MYSKSLKINVFSMSKPHAMISFTFSCANRLVSSGVKSFQRNFSSSVSWITNGTLNTCCNHLKKFKIRNQFTCIFVSHLVIINGTKWPKCIASDDGPRPVYK